MKLDRDNNLTWDKEVSSSLTLSPLKYIIVLNNFLNS